MIFVYIRIFMVVYDRENLIKKFHNNPTNNNQPLNVSTKSNQNGIIHNTDISTNKNKFRKCPPCCCFCFRKKSQSLPTSTPHYSYNNCPSIEQKQNGYLIYRFTNNNTNTNNINPVYNSDTNSPVNSPTSSSKTSLFCRPCKTPTKKLSNASDEIYQYRRNYLAHITAEYQLRNDDSPGYELKTPERFCVTIN